MKTFMLIMMDVVLTVMLFVVISIGASKLYVTYMNAKTYATTDQMTLTATKYLKPDLYNELREDYELIVGIPFIGETL